MKRDWRLLVAILSIIISWVCGYNGMHEEGQRIYLEATSSAPNPCSVIGRGKTGSFGFCEPIPQIPMKIYVLLYSWIGFSLLAIALIGWSFWKPVKQTASPPSY